MKLNKKMPLEEVAKKLNLSSTTVKRAEAAALSKLRKKLRETEWAK